MDNKHQFEEWMKQYPNHKYTDSTVKRYIRALEKAEEWLGVSLSKNILEIQTNEEFQAVHQEIVSVEDYVEINRNHGHGDLSAALSLYKKFLNKDYSEERFDRDAFDEMMQYYKEDFVELEWPDERYKWEAVKWFQKYWDIEAEDFASMLKTALKMTDNLLMSVNNFPRRMIEAFAERWPDDVREMFAGLFDESLDVQKRMEVFKKRADELLELWDSTKSHYQNENAISVYLWLKYPDKYYIYKYSEVKKCADELQANYQFKKGAYEDNIKNFFLFYDDINREILKDIELREMLDSCLDDKCYPDKELKTLTADFGFYISRRRWEDASTEPVEGQGEEANRPTIAYSKEDFLSEVYISEEKYEQLVSLLINKKNVILQGPPGVGKTFAAKRLAYSMMGEKDNERIEFIQFHQNYSYEDFIMGYKPNEDGFSLEEGVFYDFCKRAEKNPSKEYFFIIDEINRGNLSKIFGELLMAIERDYREEPITLAYTSELFSVPQNIYLIGMMNTADRSIAMIDYALRRRFSFFDMKPAFDSEVFIQYQNDLESNTLNVVIERIKELNQEIETDRALGRGFCIGHSYFCGCDEYSNEWLNSIIEYDIIPTLREYWFDDEGKVERWERALRETLA